MTSATHGPAMNLSQDFSFQGIPYTTGTASAPLLAANLELSFWGGVDQKTGEVIDRFHPLSGRHLKDTILAIPGSRGSCGGSIIMLELMLGGVGPKALIFERPEAIITLGVLVAEEVWNMGVPVIVLKSEEFQELMSWDGKEVHVQGSQVSNTPILPAAPSAGSGVASDVIEVEKLGVQLSDNDRATLAGAHSKASQISMRIIIRMAHLMGATELMSITSAHVDGAWYGPGSLALGQRLRDWGGKFVVPATQNSVNYEQRRWRALGVDVESGTACEELAQAFLDMGATKSFTCAPYLLDGAPKVGDNIAWGESNAVVYANSVLGARTLKNPNVLECLIALTARAPRAGVYLDENRTATLLVKVNEFQDTDDAFWPILGYQIGHVSKAQVPVITGLENVKPSRDDLKAFSAAFATSSSAAMFHIVNVTPEALTLEATCVDPSALDSVDIEMKDLEGCWDEFNNGASPREVDLISLGNPHFSLREIKQLAQLCQGKVKQQGVAIIITCGRSQHFLASQAGYVEDLERFGVQFLTDTCWCYVQEPVMPQQTKVIMTNSV
ncbi:hypothetical protein CC86DRAFT_458713 [Ophiobolus disseminans]|uniref:DUF521-domain-containing protein n=1 Tax=Ophiobolus disseminans TaxID=1469910 RepID=A0A6A6ZMC3_9PLEO|nr:hypothetical protein CC86DRAFT_458713 [Ophiobolus disseminans]